MEPHDPTPRPGTAGTGLRAAVERRSAPALVLMHRRRTLFLIAVLVCVGVGLFVPNWIGVGALALVMALLAWLSYLNWPSLQPSGRVGRIAGFALLAAFAVSHALDRL